LEAKTAENSKCLVSEIRSQSHPTADLQLDRRRSGQSTIESLSLRAYATLQTVDQG